MVLFLTTVVQRDSPGFEVDLDFEESLRFSFLVVVVVETIFNMKDRRFSRIGLVPPFNVSLRKSRLISKRSERRAFDRISDPRTPFVGFVLVTRH